MRKTENVKNEGCLVPHLQNGLVDPKKSHLDGATFWTLWALTGLRAGALIVPQTSARFPAFSCVSAESGAIVKKADPLIGSEFDSSVNTGEQGPRRLAVVSAGFVKDDGLHGRRLPLLMGAPCGKPSGLPFPVLRSVNPHGVARPFDSECVTSPKNNTGARVMCANSLRADGLPSDVLPSLTAGDVFKYFSSESHGLKRAETDKISTVVRFVAADVFGALDALKAGRPYASMLRRDDDKAVRAVFCGLMQFVVERDRQAVRAHLFASA